MTHPPTGELRALLDGELGTERAAEVRRHVDACDTCRRTADRLLADEAVVGKGLSRLDVRPDMVRARNVLERRLAGPDAGRAPPSTERHGAGGAGASGPRAGRGEARAAGRGRSLPSLRAAAAVVLLVAGVASALPGSPVRDWIGEAWDDEGAARPPATPEDVGRPPSDPTPDAGPNAESTVPLVRVQPSEGRIRVRIVRPPAGIPIRVRMTDGRSASVSASGSTTFRSGAGFVEVVGPEGAVVVELPRDVPVAQIRWEDRILFDKEGSSVSFPTLTPEGRSGGFTLVIPE